MAGAGIEFKDHRGTASHLAKDPAGTGFMDAIEDPADIVIAEIVCIDWLTEEQLRILVSKEILQVIERGMAGEGILDHSCNDGPRIDQHLTADQVIDEFNQAKTLDIGPDDRMETNPESSSGQALVDIELTSLPAEFVGMDHGVSPAPACARRKHTHL